MELTDSLGLGWQCFEIVAEVPGTAVAAEVSDIAFAAEGSDIAVVAEGIQTVDSELGIEVVELHIVGLAAVGYMSLVPGKLDSLDERQLRQTIWRADCKLPAVPVAVGVE